MRCGSWRIFDPTAVKRETRWAFTDSGFFVPGKQKPPTEAKSPATVVCRAGASRQRIRIGGRVDVSGLDPVEKVFLHEEKPVDRRQCSDKYIHYYNHKRIKTKLGGLSPVAYRTRSAVA